MSNQLAASRCEFALERMSKQPLFKQDFFDARIRTNVDAIVLQCFTAFLSGIRIISSSQDRFMKCLSPVTPSLTPDQSAGHAVKALVMLPWSVLLWKKWDLLIHMHTFVKVFLSSDW